MAFRAMTLAGVALLASLTAASPAFAQFDMFNKALESIGLSERERDPIDYRERAPLVVPPDASRLRAPEAPAGSRNAAWPQDPDVLERRRKAEEAKLPMRGSLPGFSATERIDHVTGQKRNAYAGVPTHGSQGGGETGNPAMAINPNQLGRIMASSSETVLPSGVEPKRQYLTEPPKGYRQAAKGAPMRSTMDAPAPSNDSIQMNIFAPRN